MLKKTVFIFLIIFFNLALGMEEDFTFINDSTNPNAVSLPANIVLNHYAENSFSVIYPLKSTNINSMSDVYFFDIKSKLAAKIAFVAKKIFVVDADDFTEKVKLIDKTPDIQNINVLFNKKNIKKDTIYQVNLYNGVIVVALSSLLKEYNNLIFAAPNIVFTDKKFWTWAQNDNTQKDNIFGGFDLPASAKIEYQEQYTIKGLQDAAKESLADSFVRIDDTSKTYWQSIIDQFTKKLSNTASVNTINNGITILHSFLQENVLPENLHSFSTKIQEGINDLSVQASSKINTDVLKNLWGKNAELAVPIINALANKSFYMNNNIEIIQNIAVDWKAKGYELINNGLQKKNEEQVQLKETIEIYYKDLQHGRDLTLVNIPEKTETKNNLFYADLVDFCLVPSVIKAPKITLYTYAQKDIFNELEKAVNLKPKKIQMPKVEQPRKSGYLIDLSQNQNAHIAIMLQENYLQSRGNHKLVADHITIVDQAIQNTLSTAENKNELIANNFSPLKENTIGLIKFDLLKNQFNLSEKDSVFNGYPREEDAKATILDPMDKPDDLITSYHGEQGDREQNVDVKNDLPMPPVEHNQVTLKQPTPSDSLTLPVQQYVSPDTEVSKKFEDPKKLPQKPLNDDIQNVKSNTESLLKQVDDILKTDLFDESTKQFNTEQCNKLIELSIGLSMLARSNQQQEKLATDSDSIRKKVVNFFYKKLPYNIMSHQKIVFLMTQDNFMFIVPSKVFELLSKFPLLLSPLLRNFENLKPEFIKEPGNGSSYVAVNRKLSYYILEITKADLEEKLRDIYKNKKVSNDEKLQKSSDILLKKHIEDPKNGNNTISPQQVKAKPNWSWYKPWTWSWGGYYFKKESYERDKPEKAAQYYKDY